MPAESSRAHVPGADWLQRAGGVEQGHEGRAEEMLVVVGHRCNLGSCAGGEEQGEQDRERGPSHRQDITSLRTKDQYLREPTTVIFLSSRALPLGSPLIKRWSLRSRTGGDSLTPWSATAIFDRVQG